jgi:hypothetical protein
MLRSSPEDWLSAVDIMAEIRFETIRPYLPAQCASILDIGGGVAISDVPILRHYGADCRLTVLDGEAEAKVMRHDTPFNSMEATLELLDANGLSLHDYIKPEMIPSGCERYGFYGLVVSFAAWGFHFSPDLYLDFVLRNTKPGVMVIMDLRCGKEQWKAALDRELKFVGIAHSERKFDRMVYER